MSEVIAKHAGWGRRRKEDEGSGSALVEKEEYLIADYEGCYSREICTGWYRSLGKGVIGQVEDETGRDGILIEGWELHRKSSLPFLLRLRPLPLSPWLLCSSLQGPGLYCLSVAAVTYTSSGVLLPPNCFLRITYPPILFLLSETNAETLAFSGLYRYFLNRSR